MSAVQMASATKGVSVISMSWGSTEFNSESSYDQYFTTPGITYIAASGDEGVVMYPAASPDVLSVGGTSLVLNASGAYQAESGWIDRAHKGLKRGKKLALPAATNCRTNAAVATARSEAGCLDP